MGAKSAIVYAQSGVIPFRMRHGHLEVMLITTRGKKRWVIPKGLVESHLTPAESAALEAWEEAGIQGTIHPQPLGTFTYKKWAGVCEVEVYLLEVEREFENWLERDERTRAWFSLPDAIRRVDRASIRDLLRRLPRALESAA